MNVNLTHVVLPGIGPVCAECFSRGHIGALSLSPGEVYSFGVTEPPAQLDWDVDSARALITARPRTAQRLDPGWLKRWLTERSCFTPEHLDHIPADKLAEPGILVEIMAGPPRCEPQPFRILIDGTHRAASRVSNCHHFWAHLLTEDEQRSICTYTLEGQAVELPWVVGHGISDRQAGILVSSVTESDVA